uniref:Tail specific protease domain-containing protein n=1 Tax=Amphora coffeiformis TaxID=265554 RepID=A0A7S3KYM6_9STRA
MTIRMTMTTTMIPRAPRFHIRSILGPSIFLLLLPLFVAAQDCTDIQNYDFGNFTMDATLGQRVPTHWSWAVGRSLGHTNNNGQATQLLANGRGLTLQNPIYTTQFLQLHQFFFVDDDDDDSSTDGTHLYELEALHVVTTGDPLDNAYVKLATVDETTGTPEFSDQTRLILPTFPNIVHGSLLGYLLLEAGPARQRASIFYDGQGTMSVESLCAKRIEDSRMIDALIKFINRYYSYFNVRGPSRNDFLAQTDTIQSNVTSGDVTTLDAVQQVLGALTRSDPHVYLVTNNDTVIPPLGFQAMELSPLWDSSFAVPYGRLKERQTWKDGQNTLAMTGLLNMSGRRAVYFLLTSLAQDDSFYEEVSQALVQLLSQAKQYEIILDLRHNPGGDEVQGLKIMYDLLSAGSDNPSDIQSVYYATNSFRIDPEDENRFYEIQRAPVDVPVQSRTRMAVLTSRNCVSSCEGFVLALRQAGAILVGENTAGASGNPQPFLIPNVGKAYISTWKAGDVNGVPFEASGIAADIEVTAVVSADDDPVLDAAVQYMENSSETADSASVDSQTSLVALFTFAGLVALLL